MILQHLLIIQNHVRENVKGYGFLSIVRNLSIKRGKQLVDTATKTGLNALKAASKKLVHKAGEVTGEFIGNKTAERIVRHKRFS